MKSLNIYLCEGLSNKQQEIISGIFSNLFIGSKLTKDTIYLLLNNLSKEIIQLLSKTFSEEDSSNYLAYEPNEDLFIKFEDNKDKILSQISEYISKYKI